MIRCECHDALTQQVNVNLFRHETVSNDLFALLIAQVTLNDIIVAAIIDQRP